MYVHNLNPVIVSLGPVSIRWYGLVYVIGFLCFYFALRKIARFSSKEADSLVSYAIIGVLLGARIFYFLFYRPDLFSFSEFFAVWNGGMSYHGGFVGIILATMLWCKKHNKNFYLVADVGALVAPFIFVLGRIANFVNGEIVGKPFNGSWCVVFPGYEECRHPAQLYDALRNLITGFIIVFVYLKKEFRDGFLFWLYAALYGIGRLFTNSFRDDPTVLLGLMTGQILSLLLFVVSAIVLLRYYRDDIKRLLLWNR